MLEIKGNTDEIKVLKFTVENSEDCIFGYKYCTDMILQEKETDCSECMENNIKFIEEEE